MVKQSFDAAGQTLKKAAPAPAKAAAPRKARRASAPPTAGRPARSTGEPMSRLPHRPRHPPGLAHGAGAGRGADRRAARRAASGAGRRRWAGSTSPTTTRPTPRPCWPMRQRWPGVAWAGCGGRGRAASGVEYFDEPALVLMLAALPREHFRVFSGAGRWRASTPQRPGACRPGHARPGRTDQRTERTAPPRGYLFGGLAASRSATPAHRRRRACRAACRAWPSGATWRWSRASPRAASRSGPRARVTAGERNVVADARRRARAGLPAARPGLRPGRPARRAAAALRARWSGLTDADATPRWRAAAQFGADTRVRHLVGLDPARQAMAVAETLQPGMRSPSASATRRPRGATWCASAPRSATRSSRTAAAGTDAARRAADACRPAAHRRRGLRQLLRPRRAALRRASAELKIVQHALGDVPLVGFFAAGEIARHHLYGYTGVLTVFTGP